MDVSNRNEYKESFFFIAAIVISLLVFLLGCQVIGYGLSFQNTAVTSVHFSAADQQYVKPEPYERAIYFFGIFCFPIIATLAYGALSFIDKKWPNMFNFAARDNFNRIKYLFTITVLFIWGYFILQTTAGPNATWQNYFRINYNYYLFRLSFLLCAIALLLKVKIVKTKPIIIFSAALIVLLVTSFTQLRPETVFLSNGDTNLHFGILLGAVNQVYHGQTILTDISSQYGILYPYFMSALGHIFGFSLIKISFFFTALIFLSWLFIYLSLRQLFGKRSWFGLFAFLVILGIAHPLFNSLILRGGQNMPYYQYNPLRVIFSAFFIWYIWQYLKEETRLKYLFGYFMCGLGMLWNMDTGIPVALSWTGFLVYSAISENRWEKKKKIIEISKHLLSLLITGLLSVGAYSLYAYWRSGQFPRWLEALEFQGLFYKSGFNMLPMAPLDLWNIMIFIYLAVFLSCVIALYKGKVTAADKYKIFLVFIGIGIFTYYQGRSHTLCFFPPAYPGLILLASLIYDFRQKYEINKENWKALLNNRIFGWDLVKVIPLIIIFTYGVLNFITVLPAVGYWAKFNFRELYAPVILEPRLAEAIEFIKNNKKSDRVVIFSDNNDYLYYKTATCSGLPFSSIVEVFSQEQIDLIVKTIQEKKIKQIFYVESGSNRIVSSALPEIIKNYKEAAKSKSGQTILYEAGAE